MKIRNGFVSNSSSSSFIVIGMDKYVIPDWNEAYRPKDKSNELNIPQDITGNYEFGWDSINYNSFGDRLNWAALGAWYKEGQPGYIDSYYEELKPSTNWTQMLVEVLKEDFHVDKVYINFGNEIYNDNGIKINDKIEGYIDHQSAPHERPDNFKFFESKDQLRQWLYCKNSSIQGGNDN